MTNKVFHHEYLLRLHKSDGGAIVVADDLIAAGWLIEAGYAQAEDDYEGPRIWLTASGKKEAIKRVRR
jgi:hypothetical protein